MRPAELRAGSRDPRAAEHLSVPCRPLVAGGHADSAGVHEEQPAFQRREQVQDHRVPPGLGESGFQGLLGGDVQDEVDGDLQRGERAAAGVPMAVGVLRGVGSSPPAPPPVGRVGGGSGLTNLPPYQQVRKFRTLTELIMDAEEHVKNPYKGKKLKKHPDFPKKPLTPYFRFFMEKRAKYAKLHPEMSNLDLTKILSKKYKELPEKKKMKYIQDFQREKQEFERNLARFREDHPDLIQNAKKSDVPEKPKTPQQLWYNHEKKIYLKVRPDATTKEVKESLGKQWSQLSDKKRLKWIHKALEQRKEYEEIMRDYIQKHPELNLSEEGITRSTLTKAERQLKDKFDGRPTKPPPNSYSLYCAELMANMKDVPSTERMVLCSQQWKLLSQKEKDAYHKKCDQKKKDYEIELLRFLESLPEEEQQRVLGEEKMLGSNRKGATSPASKKSSPETGKASSEKPKRPISAMFIFSEEKRKQLQEERPELSESELTRLLARMWNDLSEKKKAKYKAREAAMKAQSEKKHGSDKEERGKLPESPKTAEEIWQQSVIGDYLARFKNDRGKALKAMEATWNNMEKKEKLMWIKKAAEDQKRYERELSEMRAPPCSTNSAKKVKFQGEPKKPPMNGYQKFSQELLSNGELNHLPLKERMVEIGSRWQRISQGQKDHYKKLAEEQQKQYKVHLDIWLKSLSPQERAAYKEHTSNKRKSIGKIRGPNPKMKPTMQSKSVSSALCLPGLGGTFGWGSQGVSCSLAIRWHSKTRALPKPVPKNPPGVSGDPAAICDSTEGLLGDVGSTNGESLQPGGVGAVPSCFVAGGRCWWPRTAAPITNQPATNPPQCSQQESEDDDDDEEDEDDDDEDEDDDDDNGDSSEEGGDSSESSSEEESEDGDECECRVSEQRQSFAPVQLQSHYAGWRWGQKPCPCLVLAPGQVRCPHPK
uniref:Nucleolar transcription factor 1 n=3 Tax=Aves TaxID=8782 RepID=A0A669Q2U1_PHACC